MTRFFRHVYGWVNADDVTAIVDDDASGSGSRIRLRDSDVTYRCGLDPDDLVGELCPVVPANPGFAVLRWYPPESDACVYRTAIVAWRLSTDAYKGVVPVTASGDVWMPELKAPVGILESRRSGLRLPGTRDIR
jgi:hypothetical protein